MTLTGVLEARKRQFITYREQIAKEGLKARP